VGKRQRKKPTPPQKPRRKGLDTSSVDRVEKDDGPENVLALSAVAGRRKSEWSAVVEG
jgi:hypothetical protein